MSANLPIDSNSRVIPVGVIGYGKTFEAGEVIEPRFNKGILRLKAIGDVVFRLTLDEDSEINMSDGDTEYFYLNGNDTITIVSGSLNIMG